MTDRPLNRRPTVAGAGWEGFGRLQSLRPACEGVGRSSGPSSRALEAGVIAVTSLAADTTPLVG
jgi:hypothetical protein